MHTPTSILMLYDRIKNAYKSCQTNLIKYCKMIFHGSKIIAFVYRFTYRIIRHAISRKSFVQNYSKTAFFLQIRSCLAFAHCPSIKRLHYFIRDPYVSRKTGLIENKWNFEVADDDTRISVVGPGSRRRRRRRRGRWEKEKYRSKLGRQPTTPTLVL